MVTVQEAWALAMREEYLGDGLYASFDGTSIKLRAPRNDEDHVVYLEAATLISFESYLANLKEQCNNVRQVQRLAEAVAKGEHLITEAAQVRMGVDPVAGGQGSVDGADAPG